MCPGQVKAVGKSRVIWTVRPAVGGQLICCGSDDTLQPEVSAKGYGMFKRILVTAVCITLTCAFAVCEDKLASGRAKKVKKPRILLIGDSIAYYYSPFVKELVKGKADVVYSGHAGDTRSGLKSMPKRLKKTKYDIIHFNWGLHDLKKKGTQVPIDEYEKNLRKLVKMMKATGAKLVFASITPVGARAARRGEDVVRYNAVAKKVMDDNNIPINDLYALAKPQLADIQKKDNVHFNEKGSRLFAKAVVKKLDETLKSGKKSKVPKTSDRRPKTGK